MASRLKVFEDQGDRKSVFLKELAKKYDVEGSGTITGDDLDKVVNDVMTLMKDKQYLEGTNKEMEDHIEALSHKLSNTESKVKKTHRSVLALGLSTMALAIAGSMSLYFNIGHANTVTRAKISDSVHTSIKTDVAGVAHLTDKASGNELTVRSEGDMLESFEHYDALTDRKLTCVAVGDVAHMVNNLSTGTTSTLVMKNAEGVQTQVISIAGDFEDAENILSLGSIQVIMDDDGCNKDASDTSGTDIESAGPVGSNTEDAKAADAKADDGLFKRHLRTPYHDTSSTTSIKAVGDIDLSERKSEILFKNRLQYTTAHAHIKEGRQLFGAGPWVPVSRYCYISKGGYNPSGCSSDQYCSATTAGLSYGTCTQKHGVYHTCVSNHECRSDNCSWWSFPKRCGY